jgi:hypothetical protein
MERTAEGRKAGRTLMPRLIIMLFGKSGKFEKRDEFQSVPAFF